MSIPDSQTQIQDLIASLSSDGHDLLASELEALQSIYGSDAIQLYRPSANSLRPPHSKLSLAFNIPLAINDISIDIVASLDPDAYPSSAAPQLQLLSRYIGSYGVDSNLFGTVLKTYMSSDGVEFVPGDVCIFDGLQNITEQCTEWYEEKMSQETVGRILREGHNSHPRGKTPPPSTAREETNPVLPSGVEIFEAESIVDRKSSFVGRACALTHPSHVRPILDYLTSDRRIARAAHPIINAWRCEVDGVLHQDNDDDGESAAGGRLAHLLQILDVKNVIVIVTRYFGGIHLGPDRFKHINQAARNALESGGFLEDDSGKDSKRSGRGSHK